MSSVCAEQHKFVPSRHILSPNKSLIRDIDIPPRKLLTRRPSTTHDIPLEMYSSDDNFLQKFLPRNNIVDSDDDDSDPYSSDHFRMYEFKVRRCTRSRSHDWTDCPFSHPGEKARRRDPRRYHYSGTVCPEYRRGGCSSGDSCEFAHGVFECWLHPARYRTEACKDGKNCKRKVCFFAHTPRQLRILPVNSHNSSPDMSCKSNKFLNPASGSTNCCLFCHCAATSSPTSTLSGMSHSPFSPSLSPSKFPVSPPLSPVKRRSANGVSPISRYCDRFAGSEASGGLNRGVVSYKDALTELMSSLKGLNLIEVASPVSATKALNLTWLDVSLNCEDQQQQYILSPTTSFNCEDQQQQQYILSPTTSFNCEDQQQQQFILSPTTSFTCEDQQQQQFIHSPTTSFNCEDQQQQFIISPSAQTAPATCVSASFSNDNGSSSCPAPDLGWVNELLM